jgi:hypothetical protein
MPMNREDAKRWIGYEVRMKPVNGAQHWGHGLLMEIEGKCGIVKPHGHGGRTEKVPLKLLKPHKSAFHTTPIRNRMEVSIPLVTPRNLPPIPKLLPHGDNPKRPADRVVTGIFHASESEPVTVIPKQKETAVQTRTQTLTHVKQSNGKAAEAKPEQKSKHRSMLNDERKFVLWEFLRKNETKQRVAQEKMAVNKIAEMAAKHCGFPVSESNIYGAASVIGLELPRTRRGAQAKATAADRVIATRLMELFTDLGKEVPDDLRQIVLETA